MNKYQHQININKCPFTKQKIDPKINVKKSNMKQILKLFKAKCTNKNKKNSINKKTIHT